MDASWGLILVYASDSNLLSSATASSHVQYCVSFNHNHLIKQRREKINLIPRDDRVELFLHSSRAHLWILTNSIHH